LVETNAKNKSVTSLDELELDFIGEKSPDNAMRSREELERIYLKSLSKDDPEEDFDDDGRNKSID
jgi:hypothetical protein